jgi:hypothetical protein
MTLRPMARSALTLAPFRQPSTTSFMYITGVTTQTTSGFAWGPIALSFQK